MTVTINGTTGITTPGETVGSTITYTDTGILGTFASASTGYNQVILQNSANGTASSTDVIVSNDQGTASTYYGDFGMNSSGWTGSLPFSAANVVYMTSTSGPLSLGSVTSNPVYIATNSTVAQTIDTNQNTTFAGSVNAPNTFGFKNRIINGAMGIWQRGTTTGSVTGTTAPYIVDRFYGYAGTGNITISQSSDVPSNFTYSCSMVGTGVSITQHIESRNCIDLAGATVTVSFWAKSTAGSDNLQVSLYTATAGVDNWGSQTSTANTVSASPAGTWTYYTTTFTSIPSTATNGVGVGIARGSNATSTTLITGVQLEKGSAATSFDYRPYGTELSLCQRYCWVPTPSLAISNGTITGTAGAADIYFRFPVTMRTAPTLTSYPSVSNIGVYSYASSSSKTPTSLGTSQATPDKMLVTPAWSGTFSTAGTGVVMDAATGNFVFASEL